jgi:hypothetical protein
MPQYLDVVPGENTSPGPVRRPRTRPAPPGTPHERTRAEKAHGPAASVASEGPGPPPLPCPLQSDNCNERIAFPASAARTAWALQVNVQAFVHRHGLERVGFLTLTFAKPIFIIAEAQKRLASLRAGVLQPRYLEAIRVLERHKSGGIHYHLLVAMSFDIRTGFDFAAACPSKESLAAGVKADYRSASPALQDEWAYWRRTAKLYGFGRTELLPIRSDAEAVGRYVGGYIGKHCEVREERDRGARLVAYMGPRVATQRFAWATGNGQAWRRGLEALVRDLARSGQIDSATVEAMRRRYGQSWAWTWRDVIAERALTANVDRQTGEIIL